MHQQFVPNRSPTAAQPAFVRDLHGLWNQVAFAWHDEPASAAVTTWFVDHRFHFPICTQSRSVRLYSDFLEWEQRIRDQWRDHIIPGLSIEFHAVPLRHVHSEDRTPHVILISGCPCRLGIQFDHC